jgi:hypothetical protein
MTDEILNNCTECEKFYVWKWVNTGLYSQNVSKDFINAWNSCNVLVWIEHKEHFKDKFNMLHFKKKDYTDLCDILEWITELYGEDDLFLKEIMYETIYEIKTKK